MPHPVLVFVIPGFALFFIVQMLICEAYHFHLTMAIKRNGRRQGAAKSAKKSKPPKTGESQDSKKPRDDNSGCPDSSPEYNASATDATSVDSEGRSTTL